VGVHDYASEAEKEIGNGARMKEIQQNLFNVPESHAKPVGTEVCGAEKTAPGTKKEFNGTVWVTRIIEKVYKCNRPKGHKFAHQLIGRANIVGLEWE
jgi:hypothetical protein